MESVDTIVVVTDSSLDYYDDRCNLKSNLKRNLSFKSKQICDSSELSISDVSQVSNRRVHFRDTIEVFSDGEETFSIPLNDDFTSFPSLRSPLRRIIGRRQRLPQRYFHTSDDLYMVGDLYSNVPIIVLKKNVNSSSTDLVAPLATMDDMDLFDGFDDDDSMSEWIDDVDDPSEYYLYGNDDLSAESDSEDVDEVMGMLLREKCLSDEEDLAMWSSNEENYVSVDIVKKEISVDDFFDTANIEEIESSSSTDSVADSDHLNGITCFDEGRDVVGNLMDIIPEEQFQVSYECSDDCSDRLPSEDDVIKCHENKLNLSKHHDDLRETNYLESDRDFNLHITSEFLESNKTSRSMSSSIFNEFDGGPIRVSRSKSSDFKVDGDPTKANPMVDSGFASLEMTDLESKFSLASLREDNSRKLVRRLPSSTIDERTRIEEDSQDDKFSCSSDSNVSSSFVELIKDSKNTCDLATIDISIPLIINDFIINSSPGKDKRRIKIVENETVKLTEGMLLEANKTPSASCVLPCHKVKLLPILTWIFNPSE